MSDDSEDEYESASSCTYFSATEFVVDVFDDFFYHITCDGTLWLLPKESTCAILSIQDGSKIL